MRRCAVYFLFILFVIFLSSLARANSYQWIASFGLIGKEGKEPGEFEKPTGMAISPDGSIYVSDYFLDRVEKFSPDGKFLLQWGKSGKEKGAFDSPGGVALDSKGDVYVADTYNHRVQKFNAEGQFISEWGEKKKANNVRSALNFFWDEDMEMKFYYPAKIAVSPKDEIYVADSYNNRVQVFTSDGKFLRKWGGLGIWGGRFRVASGIAFDPEGNVLVGDFYNNRVQKFDSATGHFLGSFGSSGEKKDQFNGPTGIAVDADGTIYVSDFHHSRIQKFHSK
ncbi:MAG: 6-bladed beta-propeller [Nitrospirae bacterium]|nr:6-bladed beta-propeller [Nitrospirota bacterium]